ncbi:hypothetical protein GCM10009422_24890 [Brevundimonas kwangchunensis]|uniref:DUF2059 domain-containing protein n=1 Tax=Brevundimonas kwangchunensis TaxID=322163 RepID=A0ABN1H274_9CAUL
MRKLAIIIAMALAWTAPAVAQETPSPEREAHLALADRYLELTQGGDLVKQMRNQIGAQFEESEMPADQREWMTDQMSSILEEVMDLTLVELRDDVADSFTVQELEAAIGFFDTPMGRAIVLKQGEMNFEIQQVMMPLIVPRFTSMMEKFCMRFDCDALGASAAKN